jgi:hypothetical protein
MVIHAPLGGQIRRSKRMKYICLGYIDETQWEGMPQSEREAMMDARDLSRFGLRTT